MELIYDVLTNPWWLLGQASLCALFILVADVERIETWSRGKWLYFVGLHLIFCQTIAIGLAQLILGG